MCSSSTRPGFQLGTENSDKFSICVCHATYIFSASSCFVRATVSYCLIVYTPALVNGSGNQNGVKPRLQEGHVAMRVG